MFIAAFLFASIYTVFVPVFAGKKHVKIGLVVLGVLGVLIYITGEMK